MQAPHNSFYMMFLMPNQQCQSTEGCLLILFGGIWTWLILFLGWTQYAQNICQNCTVFL